MSSSLIDNNTALTSSLNYGLKPSCPAGTKSYRVSQDPQNTSPYLPSQVIIINIPCGRDRTFLDCSSSFLRMTIKNMNAALNPAANGTYNSFRMDNSGASLIRKLEIYHSSNLLESIDQYGVLSSYLSDFSLNPSSAAAMSPIYGTSSEVSIDGTSNDTGLQSPGTRSGMMVTGQQTLTMACPLLSGLLGVYQDRYLPIGILNSDIRIEITLADTYSGVAWFSNTVANNAVAIDAALDVPPAAGWQVIDCQLDLQYIEIAQNVVSANVPTVLHSTGWSHYLATVLPNSSGQYNALVSARYASLKNMVVLPRSSVGLTGAGVYSSYTNSSRVNPNWKKFWLMIGGVPVPYKAIELSNPLSTGSYTEMYAEVLKSWNSLSNPHALSTQINFETFNVADAADPTTGVLAAYTGLNSYKNAFCAAIELCAFSNKTDVILSGFNTLSCNMFIQAEFSQATDAATTYTLDTFACFDQIFIIEMGILSVRK